MSIQSLQRFILNTNFEDIHDLVRCIAHKFERRYHIPFEELIGPAYLVCVKEYHRWQEGPKTAALSTWIYTKVWYGLMSFVRNEIKRQSRICNELDLDQNKAVTMPSRRYYEIRDELSERGRLIVSLLTEARHDLALSFSWRTARTPQVTKTHLLICLRDHLEDLGWDQATITQTFNEIKEALQ